LIIILVSATIGSIVIGLFTKRYAMVSFIFGNILMGGVWYGMQQNYIFLTFVAAVFIVMGVILTAVIFKYKKINEEMID
jgi:hypothetical protein